MNAPGLMINVTVTPVGQEPTTTADVVALLE
jgi:hypothetical protein